jgi:hypothetical protein
MKHLYFNSTPLPATYKSLILYWYFGAAVSARYLDGAQMYQKRMQICQTCVDRIDHCRIARICLNCCMRGGSHFNNVEWG